MTKNKYKRMTNNNFINNLLSRIILIGANQIFSKIVNIFKL